MEYPPPERPTLICSADGCHRPWIAQGFCNSHYKAWKRGRYLQITEGARQALCSYCDQKHYTAGLCRLHYRRWKVAQGLFPHSHNVPGEPCTYPGCPEPIHARGYCRFHYDFARENDGDATTFCKYLPAAPLRTLIRQRATAYDGNVQELARVVGVSPDALRKFAQGRTEWVHERTADKYACKLGTPPAYLWGPAYHEDGMTDRERDYATRRD